MRHYEILLLIHPDQVSQTDSMLERYVKVIQDGAGKIHRQEDWGKLQLAYKINKLHKAHYFLLNIECDPKVIAELSNMFKFNDAVIRSLITKCDAAITDKSIFLKNKEQEKSRESRESREHTSSGNHHVNKSAATTDAGLEASKA